MIHLKNLKGKTSWGHLYKDFLPAFQGMRMVWPIPGLMFIHGRWNPELLGFVEGYEGSVAQKITEFIENSKENFPYCNEYHFLPGSNSNTYISWVLKNFPESKIKLS